MAFSRWIFVLFSEERGGKIGAYPSVLRGRALKILILS
jgi:hypothetical protein